MAAQKKTTQSPSLSKIELASEVAKRVEIERVRLLGAYAVFSPEQTRSELPTVELSQKIKTAINEKVGQITVVADFTLKGRYDDEPNEGDEESNLPLRIGGVFELVYGMDSFEGLSEDHFRAFGELNGPYNGWPYWREFVQSTVARMGLPPLTLPVFRVRRTNADASAAKKKKKKSAKRKSSRSRDDHRE